MIHDALNWIEDHPDAAKEDILEKQKDVESIVNPIHVKCIPEEMISLRDIMLSSISFLLYIMHFSIVVVIDHKNDKARRHMMRCTHGVKFMLCPSDSFVTLCTHLLYQELISVEVR